MRFQLLVFTFVITFWSSNASAQEFIGTRPIGMGEAVRGTLMLNDAIYINPATMAMTKQYSLDAQTQFQPTINQDLGINVSLIDTRASTVGAGVGYNGNQVRNDEQKAFWHHTFYLSLAQPISKFFSFGATAKGAIFEGKPKNKTFVNGDLGIYVIPGDYGKYFQVGAVLYNFARDVKEFPRQIGGGVKVSIIPSLSVTTDVIKPLADDSWKVGSGIEFVHKTGISARAGGTFLNGVDENVATYSAGLGYFVNQAGVYYSFRNRVDNTLQTHSLALSLFF